MFKKEDTQAAKGIAIIAMLIHHLYLFDASAFVKINSLHDLVNVSSSMGKVCVSLLTILSGYGLMESYKKFRNKSLVGKTKFVISHLIQLYSMYCVIWLVIFIYKVIVVKDFVTVYGKGCGAAFNIIMDFFGVAQLFNSNVLIGMWYILAIVLMYVSFPIMERFVRKGGYIILAVLYLPWVIVLINMFYPMMIINTDQYLFCAFPFALGIFLSQKQLLGKIKLNKVYSWGIMFIAVILRWLIRLPFDTFFALVIVIFEKNIISNTNHIKKVLVTLGKHSANIWLLHLTVAGVLSGLVSRSEILDKIPFFMFVLAISLFISIMVENVKHITHFDKFIKKVRIKVQK